MLLTSLDPLSLISCNSLGNANIRLHRSEAQKDCGIDLLAPDRHHKLIGSVLLLLDYQKMSWFAKTQTILVSQRTVCFNIFSSLRVYISDL